MYGYRSHKKVTMRLPVSKLLLSLSAPYNLALRRPASQSTTAHGGLASRANDGNKDNIYNQGSCSHTREENYPWWKVDLGGVYKISGVNITSRINTRKLYVHVYSIASVMLS